MPVTKNCRHFLWVFIGAWKGAR